MSIRYSERLSNKTSELPAKECIIVQFNRCATCNILLESPEINFRATRDFVELLKQVFG